MTIDDRPEHVTKTLISLKYWDKKNMILFLSNFIQDNCDKISVWIDKSESDLEFEKKSSDELRIQIIELLQNVNHSDKIILR